MAEASGVHSGHAPTTGALVLQPCWRQVDATLAAEVRDLWTRAAVLADPDELQRRVQDVVCVARDAAGALVAIATAQPGLVPFLGEELYHFRLFVAPSARARTLPDRMLRLAQQVLAADAASAAPASAAIGLFIVLENPRFAKLIRRAVWRRSGMIYGGRTPSGHERRFWYFPGARLREQSPRGLRSRR